MATPPLPIALLATWMAAACQPDPLGPVPCPATLQIENPQRWPLALAGVVGDELQPLTELGDRATLAVEVRPGAYVVHARTPCGVVALPAPMFAEALPANRTVTLVVPTLGTAAFADADFAFVAAGPCVLGDTLGIGQEDERPARIEHVPAFWLQRHEVTNREFVEFLRAAGGDVAASWCAFDSRKFRCSRSGAGVWSTDAPTLPVVTVSLAGAQAYCAWRTRVTGVRHRLPRESEWEKAARGPASLVFSYGNVYRRTGANQESGVLLPVGSFAANGYGLHDTTGNAFEWTSDAWRDPTRPERARGDEFQVLRGGSFVLDGTYVRNSFRMRQRPDVRADDIGFRVARDLDDIPLDR